MKQHTLVQLAVILCLGGVHADGNDWVNPQFVLQKSGAPKAQQTITKFAGNLAREGPWTVFGHSKILPPSGDRLDYLSWAPYHWPDCNWCTGPRSHLAAGGNRTTENDDPDSVLSSGPDDDSDPYADEDGDDDGGDSDGFGNDPTGGVDDWESNGDEGLDALDDIVNDSSAVDQLLTPTSSLPLGHRRMMKRARQSSHSPLRARDISSSAETLMTLLPNLHSSTVSIVLPSNIPGSHSSTSTQNVASGTNGAAANARKTSKSAPKAKATDEPKNGKKPTSTKPSSNNNAKCTPSPSSSLPPSATWTTCNYVVRDGKMNPDVRDLPGVSMFADAAQGIVYNALAYVFTDSGNYAQNVASFVNTFFLDSKTGMHPRVKYGQTLRGPGKQDGQYLGVLDLRGMVKVANAIQIMRVSATSVWTSALDKEMTAWASQYVSWLRSSALGQKALSAPNNHGTFAANQLAAIAIVEQNANDASAALRAYFNGQFKDQIAASGEQPYEAVRTRPFHYRCFNLEGMITNAKLGDQIGVSFWNAKSKYGATIKDALDFVMKEGPGQEDIADIFPHVASVAAAYGDPDRKYDSFLQRNDKRYQMAPYYYYDQAGSLTKALTSSGRSGRKEEDAAGSATTEMNAPAPHVVTPTIPFECPAAFANATQVELDDGIYVTCDQLKPFYGYVDDANMAV